MHSTLQGTAQCVSCIFTATCSAQTTRTVAHRQQRSQGSALASVDAERPRGGNPLVGQRRRAQQQRRIHAASDVRLTRRARLLQAMDMCGHTQRMVMRDGTPALQH